MHPHYSDFIKKYIHDWLDMLIISCTFVGATVIQTDLVIRSPVADKKQDLPEQTDKS